MADFYSHLIAKLAADGVGVNTNNGRTLFRGIYPDKPDNLVAILGRDGITMSDQRDIPVLEFPRFQVMIRNTDYEDAATKFRAVRTSLHGLIAEDLPTISGFYWHVKRLHVEQEGGPIGHDSKNRFEFSINFTGEAHYEAVA